jgi:hypothetical protein
MTSAHSLVLQVKTLVIPKRIQITAPFKLQRAHPRLHVYRLGHVSCSVGVWIRYKTSVLKISMPASFRNFFTIGSSAPVVFNRTFVLL